MTDGILAITAAGTYILGLVSSYASRIWQTLFLSVRIPRAKLAKIYYYLSKNKTFSFAFEESFPSNANDNVPEVETSFIVCKGIPLWLNISEKYLTTGWKSKEEILSITVFRFNKSKLFDIFKDAENEKIGHRNYIDVFVGQNGYFRLLNRVKKEKFRNEIYLEPSTETSIKNAVSEFDKGKRERCGILLYGPPGNGKTSIIKKVACDYDYNVYIPIFRPDMTNDAIISVFADIPFEERAIIVLEDFDNLFHHRYPESKDAKYTFDVFLNVLDGLYVSLENKLIFITANDLEKIDRAIKNRPSRMDFIQYIENPKKEARINILRKFGVEEDILETIALLTDGQSAAVIAEIGRRKPSGDDIKAQIEAIIESFKEDPKPEVVPLRGIEDVVSDGILKSLGVRLGV